MECQGARAMKIVLIMMRIANEVSKKGPGVDPLAHCGKHAPIITAVGKRWMNNSEQMVFFGIFILDSKHYLRAHSEDSPQQDWPISGYTKWKTHQVPQHSSCLVGIIIPSFWVFQHTQIWLKTEPPQSSFGSQTDIEMTD